MQTFFIFTCIIHLPSICKFSSYVLSLMYNVFTAFFSAEINARAFCPKEVLTGKTSQQCP